MDEDYEIDCSDIACGKCGYGPLHFRRCNAIGCEDGWVDESEFDCVNFAEGEEFFRCDECFEGVQRWCPKCGWNWGDEQKTKELDDDGETEQSTDE